MERKEYVFVYNGTDIYSGWFDSEERMATMAQGMVIGLGYRKKDPEVRVFEIRENNRHLVRVQR